MQVCRHANIIIFIHSSRTNSEFYSRYMQIQARGQKQGHATGLHHQIQWQYEGVARGQQSRAKQSPPTRLIQGLHITYRPLPKALRGHTAGSTLSSLISIISTTSWRSRSSSGQVKASLKVSCRSLLGSSKTLPCEA